MLSWSNSAEADMKTVDSWQLMPYLNARTLVTSGQVCIGIEAKRERVEKYCSNKIASRNRFAEPD